MPDARRVISELGPVVRDESHLKVILQKLKPTQRKIVYAEIKPYLKFACREYRKLMRHA